ncbi:M protein trans-acting positive regulator PRD domain-containing protein [Streptococcus hillyeri]|uniref:M protein trans-acting positive regulator PRD domain-containing protein n=1 Tax=Streptococcus hillyeri TaxID=2282420 RepID=UPI001FE5D524|nr:M protein trans-acting positive regulator PRD domain-containing protein [Streptococcus hillyeri]
MIVQSNLHSKDDSLELLPERYLFFAILVSLTWKRREFPLNDFPHKEIKRLKKMFIYPILVENCQLSLKPHLATPLTSKEMDYIFLAYCTTHVVFAKDKWTDERKLVAVQAVLQDSRSKHLISKFKKVFGTEIVESDIFLTSMTFLSRTFLFGLQNLIPFINHYEHHLIDTSDSLYIIIKNIIQEWMSEEGIQGFLDQHRLYFLYLYLRNCIQSSLPSLPIHIILGSQLDLDMIEGVLKRNFTEDVAIISRYNLLADTLKDAEEITNQTIIITTKKFLPYLEQCYHGTGCHFITIAIDLHINQQRLIQNTVSTIRLQTYFDKLASIEKKAKHYLT